MIHRPRKKNNRTTIALILVVVLGVIAYSFLSRPAAIVTSVSAADIDNPAVSDSLVVVEKIKSLKIDTKLFSDPAFVSLEDRTVDIPEQPIGRNNPFAPLPSLKTVKR